MNPSTMGLFISAVALAGIGGCYLAEARHYAAENQRLKQQLAAAQAASKTGVRTERTAVGGQLASRPSPPPARQEPSPSPAPEDKTSRGAGPPPDWRDRVVSSRGMTLAEIEAEAGETEHETQANARRRLEKEPIDEPWARENEAAIREALRRAMPKTSSTLVVECRSTYCAIELEHASEQDAVRVFGRLFKRDDALFGGKASTMVTYTDSVPVRQVILASRPGTGGLYGTLDMSAIDGSSD